MSTETLLREAQRGKTKKTLTLEDIHLIWLTKTADASYYLNDKSKYELEEWLQHEKTQGFKTRF